MRLFAPTNFVQGDFDDRTYSGLVYTYSNLRVRWILNYDTKEDDYLPLHSEFLKRTLGDREYRKIMDAGLSCGLLECNEDYSSGVTADGHYMIPGYSKGYRIGKGYRGKWQGVELPDKVIERRIAAWRKQRSKGRISYQQALESALGDLTVKPSRAMWKIIKERDEKHGDHRHKKAVELIQDGQFKMTVDDYGRMHTNVSGLWGKIRPYLRARGKRISQVDLPNSQAMMIYLGCLEDRAGESGFEYLPTEVHVLKENTSYVVQNRPPNTYCPDLENYRFLLESGQLYDYWLYKTTAPKHEKFFGNTCTKIERDKFKSDHVFRTFYGPIRKKDHVWLTFKEEFPTVAKWIEEKKKPGQEKAWFNAATHKRYKPRRGPQTAASGLPPKPTANGSHYLADASYKALACQMQRTESELIRRCVERIIKERPDLWIATVHDSILTTYGDGSYIKSVMHDELLKDGLDVNLKVKRFD